MNKTSRISFGPGAASLILIVVVLSMSVLGILALLNAHSNSKLSQRSVEVVQAGYELNAQAEQRLAALDTLIAKASKQVGNDELFLAALEAALPPDMTLDDRTVSWSVSDGLRTLDCAVELMPLGESVHYKWVTHQLTAVTEDIWN